jgi:hypothetical protein
LHRAPFYNFSIETLPPLTLFDLVVLSHALRVEALVDVVVLRHALRVERKRGQSKISYLQRARRAAIFLNFDLTPFAWTPFTWTPFACAAQTVMPSRATPAHYKRPAAP